ncbi:hypothetical protein LCGC14_3092700, partial [marine sediment metagenome]
YLYNRDRDPEMTQILPNPIANLDKDGRLVKLHCAPGERCNLDDAEDKRMVSWAEAFGMLARQLQGHSPHLYLCQFCFGGEGDE